MTPSQYARVESHTHGTRDTPARFIRACHKLLSKHGRKREQRDARHIWIRSCLDIRARELEFMDKYRF
jgi:hypothetical protein